ncbi:MAG: ParM/StbA family protein [Balneolales bacterium]
MSIKSYIFPSVFEGHNTNLQNVTDDQLRGMKIREGETDYIVGDLALSEGHSPHKAINSSPHDIDYKLLLSAGLLTAANGSDEAITLTTGFPFSTIQINQKDASSLISNVQSITQDTRPFGGKDHQIRSVSINKVDIIPELIGCIIAARNGEMDKKGNFFMVSLGYGTLEIGLSTDEGIIQRTFNSASGIRFAIDLAMKELAKTHYLGLRTEHQFDTAFRRGNITTNRKRIDLSDLRKQVLTQYYKDVVSPLIKNTWTDDDFNRANTIVLVGGGSLYPDLVDCFREEFAGFANIEIPSDPLTMASQGYCIRSQKLAGNGNGLAVGLDIGNAHTTVSIYEPE